MIDLKLHVTCAALLSLFAASGIEAQSNGKSTLPSSSAIPVSGQITSGRGIMVSSGQPGWEHTEYIADAHPTDPNKVMICVMRFSQERNQLASGAYVTFNGGKTWKLAYNDDSSKTLGVWDPACAFGENSQTYFVTLGTDNQLLDELKESDNIPYELWGSSKSRLMNVYSSPDGGQSWNLTNKLSKIDREDLRVDRTDGPFHGRMYIYGRDGLWLIYSKDGGKTWLKSEKRIVEGDTRPEGHGSILPDGTLLLPVTESVSNKPAKGFANYVSVTSSRNGGESLDQPVRVFSGNRGCGGMMAMASDHSVGPFRGRAYIVWGEFVPGLSGRPGTCTVILSRSDDKGSTWSKPVRVTNSVVRPLNETILMPQIAVNNKGVIGIAWYEPKKGADGIEHTLGFNASLDGGESWTPGVKVSPHPYLESTRLDFAAHAYTGGGGLLRSKKSDVVDIWVGVAPRSYQKRNNMFGDYAAGLTAGADGRFHAFWIGNRTGRGELYTAPVSIKGKVGRLADAFKGLKNVTSALEVQITSSVWDRVAKTVSLKYQFRNNSQDVVKGPLRIRLRDINSLIGAPNLILPKTINSSTQLLVDGSNLVPPKGLSPGQTSRPGSLVFKFDEVVNHLTGVGDPVVRTGMEVYGVRTGKSQ